jgi:hypothetical protein
MVVINRYWKKEAGEKIYIVSLEISVCPICGEILIVIGSRTRKVIENETDTVILVVRRLRCKGCRIIHHELPDMVIPYKRHSANTVERAVSGETDECSKRTVLRIKAWWAVCRVYLENILATLREKYGTTISMESAPKEIIRAVVNAHLWPHTRSVVTPT